MIQTKRAMTVADKLRVEHRRAQYSKVEPAAKCAGRAREQLSPPSGLWFRCDPQHNAVDARGPARQR